LYVWIVLGVLTLATLWYITSEAMRNARHEIDRSRGHDR
jgi:hypothetical protein